MIKANLIEVKKEYKKTYFKLYVPKTGETGTYSEHSVYNAIKYNKIQVDHLSIGNNVGQVNVSATFMFNELNKGITDNDEYKLKKTKRKKSVKKDSKPKPVYTNEDKYEQREYERTKKYYIGKNSEIAHTISRRPVDINEEIQNIEEQLNARYDKLYELEAKIEQSTNEQERLNLERIRKILKNDIIILKEKNQTLVRNQALLNAKKYNINKDESTDENIIKPRKIKRYENIVKSLPYSVEEYDEIIKCLEENIKETRALMSNPNITNSRLYKLQAELSRLNKKLIRNKSNKDSLNEALRKLGEYNYNKGVEEMGLSIYTSEYLGTLDKNVVYNFELNKKHDISIYDTDVVDKNSSRKYQFVMGFTYNKIKKQEARYMLGDKNGLFDLKNRTYVIHDININKDSNKTREAMGALFIILSAQLNISGHDYNIIIAYTDENKKTIKELLDSTKNYKYEDICNDENKHNGYFLLKA